MEMRIFLQILLREMKSFDRILSLSIKVEYFWHKAAEVEMRKKWEFPCVFRRRKTFYLALRDRICR
jgi:hypothetical protein